MYALSTQVNCSPTSQRSTDPLATLARDFLGFDPFTRSRSRDLRPQIRKANFDLLESKEAYTLRGDLPGVAEENLEVTVHEGVLLIKGSRADEELAEDSKFLVRERRFGDFERRLNLPKDADPDQVEAKLNNGVLQIVIAKKEELQARKIEIG
jgi:HSP20 family protein